MERLHKSCIVPIGTIQLVVYYSWVLHWLLMQHQQTDIQKRLMMCVISHCYCTFLAGFSDNTKAIAFIINFLALFFKHCNKNIFVAVSSWKEISKCDTHNLETNNFAQLWTQRVTSSPLSLAVPLSRRCPTWSWAARRWWWPSTTSTASPSTTPSATSRCPWTRWTSAT